MTLKELKQKCKDNNWEINKITEKPARIYRVKYKTINSKNPDKYIYHTYIRRKCSTCKKENMINRSVYYRANKGKAKQTGSSSFGIAKRSFCSKKCRSVAISGKNHYMFEEGKIISNKHSDYDLVKTCKHPYRSKNNYVPLQRWVVEKHLGRYLKPVVRYKSGKKKGKIKDHGELVHHIDMDKKHNVISNLMICNGMGHHQDIHATYNNVCRSLMDDGIIGFNVIDGYYRKDKS